ncbi:MAG: hypothetical protein N2171_03740 [Clostridia bacterium]|nr:hypothetical protein [Clostridia bacterium]
MALDDVLFYTEMDRYFCSLPKDVQEMLMENGENINSSNDLYVYAESLLGNIKNMY